MLPQWLPIIRDTLVALSALAGVVAAIAGFCQWRKELTGKAKFEVARRIAVLSLQFRNEFIRVRATSPLTFSGESAQRQRTGNESPAETQLLDEYFARMKRLESLQEILLKLRASSWEAKVVLNEDVDKLLQPLEQVSMELWGAIMTYFSTQLERARRGQGNLELDDWLRSQHAKVYGIDRQPLEKVEAAVASLLRELRVFVK